MAFEQLSDKLQAVMKKVRGQSRLTEENMEEMLKEIRMSLLEADVNYKVVKEFVNNVKEKSIGQDVLKTLSPGQMILKIMKEELVALLGEENDTLNISGLTSIMMVGLQGSGKTTTASKIAYLMKKKNNKRPLLVACDVYRPAAIDQLITLGKSIDVEVFYDKESKDVVNIATRALAYARENGFDLVILDTAGRLQVDEELMDELKNVNSVIKPKEVLLVVDAMSGQDSVNVAKAFNDKLRITGLVMSKLDGDARGGAALSIKHLTGIPIKFSGMGEKIEDLEVFYPERMAERILGMGDMLTLVEKAQEAIDEKEAKKTVNKMMNGNFTLDDMLSQMQQMNKLGSMKGLMKLIPGMPKITDEQEKEANEQMKKTKAIISSMTMEERKDPKILKASRKIRIAKGSGTQASDVNRVLNQYEKMKEMMKQLKPYMKNGKMPF
ncbi:MAG: signal recognition particle protein [Bacilli bacterium]|nr:signal recognition particle protein [Bacilli bacterium]